MSGWQNTWGQQPPIQQHPQSSQNVHQNTYSNQEYYNQQVHQQQARCPAPPMRQNEYQYQQQRQQVAPNVYNHQQLQQASYQNYMPQHQGYHQPSFMFNANANVFVPRNQAPPQQDYGYYAGTPYHQPPHHYHSNQYGVTSTPSSSYNAMYQEDMGFDAFAQFGQQSQQYNPSKELADHMQASKCSSYLTEILVGCEQLLAEGEEDSPTWISAIRQRFEDASMDEESKKIGVKLIIEMAYSLESNQLRSIDPQHTFSNLLQKLSLELKGFLRQFIVPALGEHHENRKFLDNDSRVIMAVFYAELFVKLSLENGSRFELIGNALADQIDEILKFTPKDEYMKSLLRAFKVAGAELDTSEPLRQRVDQILTIMGGYAKGSPLLSDTVKAQIFSLIECRTRGWDRVASSRVDPPAGYVAYRDNDSFDDSLDNDLTEEERQFLERNLDQVEAGKNGEDDIDDQEVMKEFGKFVKEELQQAEEQKTAEMFQGCSIEDEETNKTPAEDK